MTWICDNQTVFLHIPKCGGTSIMEYLPGRLYKEGWPHQTRSEIDTELPVWTIVRHPAARIISYWMYIQTRIISGPPLVGLLNQNKKLPEDITNLYDFIKVFDEIPMTDYIKPGIDYWYKLEEIDKVFHDLPKKNITRFYRWQTYLHGKPKCVKLIKEKYKQDFENFNYSMDFKS